MQVGCTIYGKFAWISNPVNGSRDDNYCREESGVLLTMNPKNWIGDKGYIGNNMITPFRKPAGGELLDWRKKYNSAVNKIRWMIEQVISHFKNWTIMHTDYRRPLKTFETTISAVVGLHSTPSVVSTDCSVPSVVSTDCSVEVVASRRPSSSPPVVLA